MQAEVPVSVRAQGLEVNLTVPCSYEETVQKPGYIKIRLWYATKEPWTLVSQELGEMIGAAHYTEFVCVLKPAEKVFDLLWAYVDDFEALKDQGLIQPDARLESFEFLEEDSAHLAWVL